MLFRRMIPMVAAASMLVTAAVSAQDAQPLKIALCNPAKVFEKMAERKAVEDRIRAERERVQREDTQKKAEITELRNQLPNLKPGTAPFAAKQKEVLEKLIEHEVWQKLKQAELARLEKEQIKGMFDKIADAAKDVAVARKIDVVFAERRPELENAMEQLTPDQVRQLLGQRDVLYANEKADITDAVALEVDKKYAAGAGGAAPAPPK